MVDEKVLGDQEGSKPCNKGVEYLSKTQYTFHT